MPRGVAFLYKRESIAHLSNILLCEIIKWEIQKRADLLYLSDGAKDIATLAYAASPPTSLTRTAIKREIKNTSPSLEIIK